MKDLFLYFTQLSVRACVVIPLVIAIRFLLKRQPKIYSYLMWLVVFVSLVADVSLPQISIYKPVSTLQTVVMAGYDEFMDDYNGATTTIFDNNMEYYEAVEKGAQAYYLPDSNSHYVVTGEDGISPPKTRVDSYYSPWGIVVVILSFLVLKSCLEIYAKTKNAIHYRDNIYLTANYPSPFVFGFVKPKIYIPETLAVKDLSYIIAHEQTHINRRDYIIKPLCLMITILHWFNPLVWLAYTMICSDMEMSCDEKVVATLGKDSKKPYSMLLLDFATDKSMTAAVLFGESKAESRIQNILDFTKPKVAIATALAVAVVIFSAVALGSKPTPTPTPDPVPPTFYEQLDAVNGIDHLQYKYRMGVETTDLARWANQTYIDGGEPLYILPQWAENEPTTSLVTKNNEYVWYGGCTGVRIDDGDSPQYSMYLTKEDYGIHDYNGEWTYRGIDPIPVNDEPKSYISHDKLGDDYYIDVFCSSDNTNYAIMTVHTKNGTSTANTFSMPTPDVKHITRTIRFLNENVGFSSRAVGSTTGRFPSASITIDGGKTWQALDFTQFNPDVKISGYSGCIVNIYGEIIELRYHCPGDELPGTEDNYALISTDGGLTWTGYHRTLSNRTIEKPGFDYIKITDTIPVKIIQ